MMQQQKLSPIGFKRAVFYRVWDILMVALLFLFWNNIHHTGLTNQKISVTSVIFISCISSALIFNLLHVYSLYHNPSLLGRLSRLFLAWATCLSSFVIIVYIFKLDDDFPRLVIGPWVLSVPVAMSIPRILIDYSMRSRFRKGVGLQKALVVGDGDHAMRVSKHFRKHPDFAIQVVGRCNGLDGSKEPDSGVTKSETDIPTACTIDELGQKVEELGIQRVIIAADFAQGEQIIERVLKQLAQQPVIIQFAPDVSSYLMIGFKSDNYAGQPMFDLAGCPLSSTDLVLKWLEDKVLSILILILISPLMLLIAVLIKCSSRGPVIFAQERHGVFGRPIRVLKFRSMRLPEDKAEQAQHANGAEKTVSGRFRQAQKDDPRITWIGKILRRTSMDELPQFFNVLYGNMSIVGPRPHALQHNQQFAETVAGLMKRHYMKPGITGLAQINGARGETKTVEDMEKRLRYDLHYIRNWSLWLDLKIIMLTIIKGFYTRQP